MVSLGLGLVILVLRESRLLPCLLLSVSWHVWMRTC